MVKFMKYTMVAFSLTLMIINFVFFKTIFHLNLSENILEKPGLHVDIYQDEIITPVYRTNTLENNIIMKLSQ